MRARVTRSLLVGMPARSVAVLPAVCSGDDVLVRDIGVGSAAHEMTLTAI